MGPAGAGAGVGTRLRYGMHDGRPYIISMLCADCELALCPSRYSRVFAQ